MTKTFAVGVVALLAAGSHANAGPLTWSTASEGIGGGNVRHILSFTYTDEGQAPTWNAFQFFSSTHPPGIFQNPAPEAFVWVTPFGFGGTQTGLNGPELGLQDWIALGVTSNANTLNASGGPPIGTAVAAGTTIDFAQYIVSAGTTIDFELAIATGQTVLDRITGSFVGLPGDFDVDGDVDADDIDLLVANQGTVPPIDAIFDLNDDLVADFGQSTGDTDSDVLIRSILGTEYGDATLDGEVGLDDLTSVGLNWGQSALWAGGDFDGDGLAKLPDLTTLGLNWGAGTGSSAATLSAVGSAVPEPSVAMLLTGLATTASLTLRRRRGQSRFS